MAILRIDEQNLYKVLNVRRKSKIRLLSKTFSDENLYEKRQKELDAKRKKKINF